MDFISVLTNSSLPTAVAVVIALAAIMGYYFFVIPLMGEHKELKEKYEALVKDRDNGEIGEFSVKVGVLEKALHGLKTSLEKDSSDKAKKLAEVEKCISDLAVKQETHLNRGNGTLHEDIERLQSAFRRMAETAQTYMANSSAKDDSIEKDMTELLRQMSTLNEKQSQILGALLGLGRIQDRNRSL